MVNKKKSSLNKRYQASYESKESGSSGKSGVMNWKKIDAEISFFSPVEGRNRINIVPYTIKTKNHPLVKKGEFEVGDMDYVMDIFTHRGVGPSEASVLCLKQTFGKPCPICEQSAMLRKQGKEKEAGDLKPSRRVYYNIEDLKNPGELKVFEASHYLFEKELIDEARDDEDGGYVDFADPEEGKEIKFRCSKTKKNGFEFNEFKSFSFEDRDDAISEDLLDQAISFDELLNIPTYEEAEKILFGQDDDAEEDGDNDDEPAPKKPVEEDDDVEDDEPVKKPSKKSEPVEEDEWDDEPAPAKKPSKKAPVEEDDVEEDEKPAPKKAKNEKCGGDCGECPFGHKFGKDCDQHDDCDDCDVWDKCIKAQD